MRQIFERVKQFISCPIVPAPFIPAYNAGEVTCRIREYSQMDTYSCGAASGFTIVKSFDPDADREEFYDAVSPDPDEGTSERRLVKALKQFGVDVKKLPEIEDFAMVRKCINRGRLILAGVYYDGDPDKHHWLVVYGYGDNRHFRSVFTACNARSGQRRRIWEKFETVHEDGSALICSMPGSRLPLIRGS
jgi:hypothetical protein